MSRRFLLERSVPNTQERTDGCDPSGSKRCHFVSCSPSAGLTKHCRPRSFTFSQRSLTSVFLLQRRFLLSHNNPGTAVSFCKECWELKPLLSPNRRSQRVRFFQNKKWLHIRSEVRWGDRRLWKGGKQDQNTYFKQFYCFCQFFQNSTSFG